MTDTLKHRGVWGLLAFVTVAVALVACGGDMDEPASTGAANSPFKGQSILVSAAADLRFAFEEMAPVFEEECDCRIEISFGSSGNFTTQIEQGLPADLFFSANVGFIDILESRGLTLEGTKQPYAVGRIVLAKNKNTAVPLTTMRDLLRPEIRKVSIANPMHAPYGVAAQEAMTAAGIWNDVQSRLVLGENASQAMQFVESGDAQAGIVPLSLAIHLKDRLDYVLIEQSQHKALSQGAAVLKRSRNPDLAKAFLAFVNSPAGREIMQKYGFEPPV